MHNLSVWQFAIVLFAHWRMYFKTKRDWGDLAHTLYGMTGFTLQWLGYNRKAAWAKFRTPFIFCLAFTVVLPPFFRSHPQFMRREVVGRWLRTIFIDNELGFYKSGLCLMKFARLTFLFRASFGFWLGVALMGLALLPARADAPVWAQAIFGFASRSLDSHIALFLPLIGVVFAALSTVRMPKVNWLTLLNVPLPPNRNPPRGREPRPATMQAASRDEEDVVQLRKAA